jgi:class 3 adenylate cyclase
MADDIAQWLEELGLGRYAQAFAENDIDLRALPHLSDDDLNELGLSLGHRRILQSALREQHETGQPAATHAARGIVQTGTTPEAERRQLTVLFCDLVGSTALSTRLDPEDMRDVLRAYQEACSGVISHYDGYVAKLMGDGVYAYFGYPLAHEDDAERAINAGLGIIEAVGALEPDLRVRIGVATGTVAVGDIIGEGASEEANVVGEAPNLAARLQEIAEPNTVVIGEATHILASGLFETTELGKRDFKGFTDPVGAWSVVSARRTESRFEATRGERLTDLVGRDEELEILLRRWERAKSGEGQVVLISGEPGIGKSRLVRELQDRVAGDAHGMRYQCSPYHSNSALYPVTEQLERAALFEPKDSSEGRLDKLEALLSMSGQPVVDAARLIASLLSLPSEGRYEPLELSPQRQKGLTLKALVDQLSGLAESEPVLFVFEDAHWIDPTTLELLELVIEQARQTAVLALLTYRPEFEASWKEHAHVTQMTLRRLDSQDCLALVEHVAVDAALSEELRERIAAQTDGVPLFVEELTKSVVEAGLGSAQEATSIDVPATLKDSLEARLDRLGSAKEIAQIGAVIGRSFDFDLLGQVSASTANKLHSGLERLVQSELVSCRGVPPDATYTFKHALVQDTAYGSLLRGRRTEIHGRIAQTLEMKEAEPEVIAHHFTEARAAERAIPHWREAAKRALGRSAGVEAIAYLEQAFELVRTLPETPDHAQLEYDLLMTLSPAVIMIKGMGSDELGTLHSRAFELASATGKQDQCFRALFGSWLYNIQRPPLTGARKVVAQLNNIAVETGDSSHKLQVHHVQWTTTFFAGELATAHHHMQEGSRIYDIHAHGNHANIYGGHDPGLCALNFDSFCLWLLGYPDQSILTSEKSTALSEEVGHKISTTVAFTYAAVCNLFNGSTNASRTYAIRAQEIAEEYGFAFGAPIMLLKRLAELAAEKGRPADSHLLEICRRPSPAGMEFFRPYELSVLARLQGEAGRIDDAFALVQDAFDLVTPYESHWCESEVHRQKGELLRLIDHDATEVENCFNTALAIAQKQGSKAWELRTVTSIAHFKRDQGNAKEAYKLLAPVYGWFTEGFDTADLQEARMLLDELG